MTKVSIIMPIYNDSQLLDKSISSIIKQSLDDLEIICVDDGSTDDSLEILNDFASKYDFIKVFSQENQGPGKARNYGISKANGEYIGFLDADDYFISNDALKELYEVADSNNADFVSGNIKLVDENGNYSRFTHLDYFTEYGSIAPEEYGIPWAFYKNIYKKDFLLENGIEFPDLKRGEDPVFLAEILSKVDKVYTVPVDVYAYYYVDGFVKVNSSNLVQDHLMHYKMVFDFLKDPKFLDVVKKFRLEMMGFIDLMGPERAEWVIKSIRDIFSDDQDILRNCEEYFYLKYKDFDDLKNLIDFNIDSSNPRISVIMPLNDTDNHLQDSINSILNQTFNDFELICLNENSVVQEFAKIDSRIKILNTDSINDALKFAKGNYVYFFHPRANIAKIAFEELYKNAISNNSDVVLFMLAKYQDNGRLDLNSPVYNLHEFFDGITYHLFTFDYKDIKEYILSNIFVPWNKFFKKEYLERYDDFIVEKINQEDILFNVKTLLRTNFISFAADYYYRYRGEEYLSLNDDYNDCNLISVINELELFLKQEGYLEELEIEFNKFKMMQILNYADFIESDDYFNYSKSFLLSCDNDLTDNLSDSLLDNYHFIVNSRSFTDYKFLKDKFDDLKSSNKELLVINQFLLEENQKLNKKVDNGLRNNKNLINKNSKLKKNNKEMKSSKSWKLTKPLRNFKRIF